MLAILSNRDDPALSRLHICLVIAISLALNLFGITWGLPNGGYDWANDSLAPLEPLAYAKRLIYQEPWWSKYPPFHFMVLAAFYAPYALYLHLTGGLVSPTDFYPYGLKDPEFSLMVFTLIARVTSALMGTGTVLINYYTARRLYGHRAGLICALLIASSYAVIYYSHNANVDVPQLFWISLALYCFVSLLETYETKYYILLGLFTALAVGTKNSAYALFIGLVPPLLWLHMRHEQMSRRASILSALVDRKLLYGFLVFLTSAILVFNLPFNWQGFTEHVQFHMGRSLKTSRVIREATWVFQGDFTVITKYLICLVQANGIPAFLLLVGGFFYCLVKFPGRSWTLLIPMVTYYIFFLRFHGAHHLRYILPVYLLLSWQAGKLAADLLAYRKIPKLISTTAISLILVHSLVYGFSLDLLLTRDSRYSAEKWMEKNIRRDAIVAAHGPEYGLPRFPAGMEVRRIQSDRGTINGGLGSLGADYLILDMSLPGRANQSAKIYQLLNEMGYLPTASFKSETPVFGADLFHAVNPEIVVFEKTQSPGRSLPSLERRPSSQQ